MNWDEYFMKIAEAVALKSKDRSTKLGCVIVGPDNEIRSTGYNGFPRNINDDVDSRHERPEKYLWTEHAERNAIYHAARMGVSIDKCRLYVSWTPCVECSRAILNSGISEIIIKHRDDEESNERWKDDFLKAKEMLEEGGVTITEFGEWEKVAKDRIGGLLIDKCCKDHIKYLIQNGAEYKWSCCGHGICQPIIEFTTELEPIGNGCKRASWWDSPGRTGWSTTCECGCSEEVSRMAQQRSDAGFPI